MHVKDNNFVIWLEIFVHSNGQLQASHLILGCKPVYFTWQSFSQALLVDNPLLSYIDVRHPNFLPPPLPHPHSNSCEARDCGPRIVGAESLVPFRDASAKTISQNRVAHRPVEEPQAQAQVQPVEQTAAESVNSSKAKPD